MTFIPLSVPLWNDLGNPVFYSVGLEGFQEQGQCLFTGLAANKLSPVLFPFYSFILWVGIVGLWSLD